MREGESLRPMASPVPAAASPVVSPPTSPLPTLAVMEGDSESDSEFVLFVDNLGAQLTPQFKSAVRDIGGIAYYGVANATDIWQPVDAGAGQMLKILARQEQSTWLMTEKNYDKWCGTGEQGRMTVGDRRILITQVYILEHLLGQSSSSCESKDIKVCIICNFSG